MFGIGVDRALREHDQVGPLSGGDGSHVLRHAEGKSAALRVGAERVLNADRLLGLELLAELGPPCYGGLDGAEDLEV